MSFTVNYLIYTPLSGNQVAVTGYSSPLNTWIFSHP